MNRPLAKDDLPDRPAVITSPPEAAGMTPMMAQYHAIKSDHPDALLFYRMGDFYELFFDDAVKASAALSIALTTRGNHLGTPIPMCGVPVHAADEYLRRLISAGHRVAVCEQTEDPAEARKRGSKSVVQREVVRLVTPGTLTEETLLEPGRANYLMAISALKSSGNSARNNESDHGCFGLAWIDISTGAFMVCQSDRQNLAATVARIDPSEVIVAEHVFQDPALAAIFGSSGGPAVIQPRAFFESSTAEGRLARFFNVASLDGFGEFTRAEIAASAAILSYVEKTQFAERPPLARPVRQSEAERMIIDAASRANLELFRTLSGETSGTLFKAIDRTVTGPGSRLLAERLASPLLDIAVIDERLETISFFLTETRLSENLRDRLRHLPDAVRALSRIALNRGGPRDLGVIQKALQSGRAIRAELGKFPLPAELGNARTALDGLPDSLADELGLGLSNDLPMSCRDGGFIEAGYRTALDEARQLRDESRRVVAGLQSRYGQETGVRSLKIKHNAVLGYFIEVTQANAAALTETAEAKAQFIHRQTMANAMRFTTTELAELEGRIKGAGESALALEIGVFDELVGAIVAETATIKRAAEALSVLDVSLGLAVLAEEQGYCRPAVDESLDFRIVGGRHPVVEQMLRRDASEPFIANDCDLSPGSDTGKAGAIWLLTGPNMGGKSTFLRQNALIAILAQAGSFVPAGSAHIGVVDRLFSRVGASDDLAHGRSTFMVEMIETASILNQAGRRSLIILDEIGRGTATFDGLSIAWATVEHLHEKNNSRAIFATHFHELTALCEHLERLAKVTMRVKEWKGEVVFLHEVMPGAADRSYGIQVARLAGLPEAVVERARDVLERLENQNTSGPSGGLLSDLPLFAVPAKGHAPSSVVTAPETPDPLAEALAALDPDDLTPREALEALYTLKKAHSDGA